MLDIKRLNSIVDKKLTRPSEPDRTKARRVSSIAVLHDGRILLGKRRDNGKWTNPGGHLEHGEDPHTGALRELREETGIITGHLIPLVVKKFPPLPEKNLGALEIHCYGLELDKPTASSRLDPDNEVAEWKWVRCDAGLPKDVTGNLHSPDNVLLKHLNLMEDENGDAS